MTLTGDYSRLRKVVDDNEKIAAMSCHEIPINA